VVDIAVMRALPDMAVIVPADANEMAAWVPIVAEYDGPVFLRISRAATLPVHDEKPRLELGKGLPLRDGDDLTIVATGSMVGRSLLAADQLAQESISARVLEIHTIKPIDAELILQAAEETGAIVTAEEHSIVGGLGSAVAEVLGDRRPTPLERVGVADTFALTALTPGLLMDAFGLAVTDVVTAAKRVLERKHE
jgi:transketolase